MLSKDDKNELIRKYIKKEISYDQIIQTLLVDKLPEKEIENEKDITGK